MATFDFVLFAGPKLGSLTNLVVFVSSLLFSIYGSSLNFSKFAFPFS